MRARDLRRALRWGLLTSTLCVGMACSSGPGTNMSPEDLLARIETGAPPRIVDVRSQGEYDSGHVPGAMHVPFYSVWSQGSDIAADDPQEVIVYCAHGPRAWIAKLMLWMSGGPSVHYLEGHMKAWKQQQLPLEGIDD